MNKISSSITSIHGLLFIWTELTNNLYATSPSPYNLECVWIAISIHFPACHASTAEEREVEDHLAKNELFHHIIMNDLQTNSWAYPETMSPRTSWFIALKPMTTLMCQYIAENVDLVAHVTTPACWSRTRWKPSTKRVPNISRTCPASPNSPTETRSYLRGSVSTVLR